MKKDLEKKVEKLEPKKEPNIDYSTLTLVQLKALAKQRNITGISQLNKAEIVAKLKK